MTDAPAPIPTEGVWSGDLADLPNWDAMPRRNRRRKRRSSIPIWVKYAAWLVALALVFTIAQIAYQALRSDSRDFKLFTDRELRLSVLRPNERIVAVAHVWQRPAIDYFRATRGLLALTDAPGDSARPIGGRLLFIGLEPRDPLIPSDAPPTFDEREWPIDTLVTVTPRRTLFFASRGVAVSAPREGRVVLGLGSGEDAHINVLRAELAKRYRVLRAVGWQRREARRARARDSLSLAYHQRRAWYHTVRRGEAVASVARLYNTTEGRIRELNHLPDDRIRVGQTLLVKPWTKQPVRFPPGVVPEEAPVVTPAPDSVAPTPEPTPPPAP